MKISFTVKNANFQLQQWYFVFFASFYNTTDASFASQLRHTVHSMEVCTLECPLQKPLRSFCVTIASQFTAWRSAPWSAPCRPSSPQSCPRPGGTWAGAWDAAPCGCYPRWCRASLGGRWRRCRRRRWSRPRTGGRGGSSGRDSWERKIEGICNLFEINLKPARVEVILWSNWLSSCFIKLWIIFFSVHKI